MDASIKKVVQGKVTSHFFMKGMKKPTLVAPKHFNHLSSVWLGTKARPFSIVDDEPLQCMIDFACSQSGGLKLPTREETSERVKVVADELKRVIVEVLKDECDYFSMTTDLWSSRKRDAFMALTIHYLTDTFEMKSFTLACTLFKGNHTAENILGELRTAIDSFGLSLTKLVMMVRDSRSNIVNACRVGELPNLSCISHTLHLTVGPFLVQPVNKKKKAKTAGEVIGEDDDSGVEDAVTAVPAGKDKDHKQFLRSRCWVWLTCFCLPTTVANNNNNSIILTDAVAAIPTGKYEVHQQCLRSHCWICY